MASGSGAVLAPVPTVAAARATGMPISSIFRPAVAAPAPLTPAAPLTPLQRIQRFSTRAQAGMQKLFGLTGDAAGNAPTPAPLSNPDVLKQQLDDLQKRSTTNVFQMRKTAATGVKY